MIRSHLLDLDFLKPSVKTLPYEASKVISTDCEKKNVGQCDLILKATPNHPTLQDL